MLQRFVFMKVCMGENAFEFIAKYNDILTIKSTYLNVLSFKMSVVISLLRPIRGVLSELCHFGFPLLRRSKGSTLVQNLLVSEVP